MHFNRHSEEDPYDRIAAIVFGTLCPIAILIYVLFIWICI